MVKGIELVLDGGEYRVDSRLIAKRLGVEHESTFRLVNKFSDEFASLGKVGFQIGPLPSGQNSKFALLNESQSIFLLTLSKNSQNAVALKLELTKAFDRLRKTAEKRASLDWQQQRQISKAQRKEETDALKALVEMARTQGSTASDSKFYMSYSKMVREALFTLELHAPKDWRDNITVRQLTVLSVAEFLVAETVNLEIANGTYYKDIFQAVKQRVAVYASTVGRSSVVALPVGSVQQQLAM